MKNQRSNNSISPQRYPNGATQCKAGEGANARTPILGDVDFQAAANGKRGVTTQEERSTHSWPWLSTFEDEPLSPSARGRSLAPWGISRGVKSLKTGYKQSGGAASISTPLVY